MPPLVFAGECRILQDHVAAAARGEGFLLFGGDCAEAFSQFSANHIRDLYRVILQARGDGLAATPRVCLCNKGRASKGYGGLCRPRAVHDAG